MARRKAKRKPAHMKALDIPYEVFVERNGGEFCGICGAPPKTRRLDRDHDHHTGRPRGVLCHLCNRTLSNRVTQEWLALAALYLARHEGMIPS